MVNTKLIVLVLFVLPAIILASSCKVSVTQTKSSSGRYDTYTATASNTGSSTITNIVLTPSATPKSLSGLKKSGSAYSITSLAAGASTSFTYKVGSGATITWATSCSSASTVAPTTATPKTTSSKTTSKATTAAPSAPSGRVCPAGTWWAPAPLTTWQWQLQGTIDTTVNAQMFDIDLFDSTTEIISTLHSQGKAVICYFSTQYENWRPDSSSFTAAVIGNGLDGWPGENYVDIRSTVVRNIMVERLNLAVSKGCDGVEPDNVDGYTASTGFPLTAADQIDFNTFIATSGHAVGLSVGLKNDVDQAKTLEPAFDWALDEQCYEYNECNTLSSFVAAGKAVFNCEYSGSAATICPYMNNIKYSSLLKTLDLTAEIKAQCCTYQSTPCAPAAHTCISSMPSRSVRSVTAEQETVANEFAEQQQELYASSATTATTYTSVFAVVAVALAALNF